MLTCMRSVSWWWSVWTPLEGHGLLPLPPRGGEAEAVHSPGGPPLSGPSPWQQVVQGASVWRCGCRVFVRGEVAADCGDGHLTFSAAVPLNKEEGAPAAWTIICPTFTTDILGIPATWKPHTPTQALTFAVSLISYLFHRRCFSDRWSAECAAIHPLLCWYATPA